MYKYHIEYISYYSNKEKCVEVITSAHITTDEEAYSHLNIKQQQECINIMDFCLIEEV